MPIKIPKISGEIKSGVLHQVLKKELSSWRNKPLIYLVDKVYQLIGLSEMERFLREDKTDLIKYVPEYFDCPMTSDLAYGMGLFFADGSCNGRAWRIVNKNKEVLETTKSAFNDIFKKDGVRFDLRLWDSYKKGTETNYGKRNHDEWSLDMYVTNPNGLTGTLKDGNRLKMIREFRKMFYFNNGKKFYLKIHCWNSYQVFYYAYLSGCCSIFCLC